VKLFVVIDNDDTLQVIYHIWFLLKEFCCMINCLQVI
jgi:hypothetical protein